LSAAERVTVLQAENAQLRGDLATLNSRFSALSSDHEALKQQLEWFKRQLFGAKSEKRLDVDPAVQGNLLAALGVESPPAPKPLPGETVTYQRRPKARDAAVNDTGLRFGEEVPREVIAVTDPEIEAIPEDRRVRIGEKVTYRLAQRPGSYVILEYTRPVYKLLDDLSIATPAAPANVLDNSVADVSFLAGMLVDKFCYHLPLYRQHQRLIQSGIQLSRSTLSTWAGRAIDLLRPIVDAQAQHVLQSRVLAMDEVPIKAGRQGKGKMRQAYFWPIYGEDDEIVFRYAPSRAHRHVQAFLGGFGGTLLSDGYEAYEAYARQNARVTRAACWSHCRRGFERAKDSEPTASAEALALIGTLYRHEQVIRDRGLSGKEKLAYRTTHSEPVVQAFWGWCDRQCHRADLLPSSPLAKALRYALARKTPLQVFLADPEVAIDTNHLERALRPIPMGKKNWLFAWTEIGAERVGVIQSLLVTCRLQGVDPYTYLVDVLQRISEHPASQVADLTPRLWKAKFSHDPMRSDLALAQQ
jgi:transposase